MKDVFVITIKWGTLYNHDDINRLYKMIKKQTKYNLHFYCFTDNGEGFLPEIIVKPLPKVNVKKEQLPYAYQKEVGLCRDDLADGELTGKRVLFFDLDVVLLKNIDEFFDLPKNDEFYTIKDWKQNDGTVGNASVYSWKVGTLGYVVKDFEERPEYYVKKFFTASQEYLSEKVIEKYGKLNFWPKEWCVSFKVECLPCWPVRLFKTPKLPDEKRNKILCFHGQPKIDDAIEGKWLLKGHKSAWKRIYKTLKPCSWIKKYLEV